MLVLLLLLRSSLLLSRFFVVKGPGRRGGKFRITPSEVWNSRSLKGNSNLPRHCPTLWSSCAEGGKSQRLCSKIWALHFISKISSKSIQEIQFPECLCNLKIVPQQTLAEELGFIFIIHSKTSKTNRNASVALTLSSLSSGHGSAKWVPPRLVTWNCGYGPHPQKNDI